ncbi:FAS1 domain-containing protein [Xylariales sp. PMI_506]|nr:FAS1 domain-containing protein [Xylariales sp. PMI_506]
MSRPRKGHHGHHPVFNFTIYEAIKKSNYTTTFAKIVDKYPDLVAALNSTSHNLTVFVPTDKAFEKIPEHHKKPSKEFVEQFLQYHIVSDLYSSLRVLHAHTLPTALKEDKLGGNPQRIRVGFGLGGLKLNFYSRIIAADIFTSNGVVHGLDNVLVPPPHASHLISLFPQKFSTVILAAERTHLGKEFHGVDTTGGTLFLPTNRAFEKLGPAANAFLFNTEKGIGYLKALLKYHIVLNETLYSDAYYGRESDGADDDSISGHYHVDLPTLLAEKSLSIDIASWGRLITIKINGRTHVSVSDGVVKEGVIHVVESVLIPPHKHKDGRSGDDAFLGGEEINVEDLVERLEPYLEKQSIGEL